MKIRDSSRIDDVNLAPPGKLRRRPDLHACKRAWQVFRFQFRPIGVEIRDFEGDHLIALPLWHVDVLENEVRLTESQTCQALLFPLLHEAQFCEEGKGRLELRPGGHERIERRRLRVHLSGGRDEFMEPFSLFASQLLKLLWRGSPHAAKPAVVCEETSITVAGALALTKRGAAHVGAGFPRTAAHHALHVLAGIGRPRWVEGRTLLVISQAVNVFAPFGHISVQVEDAPAIRFLFPMRNALILTLCGGASSALPLSLPIKNSPPGSATISMPEDVTTSMGPPGSAFELPDAPSGFVPLCESGLDFPQEVSSATRASDARQPNRRITARSPSAWAGTTRAPCC